MTGHKTGKSAVNRIISGCTAALAIFVCFSFFPPSALSGWKDITGSVNAGRSYPPLYDYATGVSYFDITLTNISGESFPAPVRLAVQSVIPSDVTVHNADGLTDSGMPYYDFSLLLGDEKLDPDETSSALRAEFRNPGRVRFNFTFLVLVMQPENPPVLDSMENILTDEGEPLELAVTASDPDGDPLAYTAEGLPEGSVFDASAHIFTWTPGYDQAGVHTVTFTVTDPGGLTDSAAVTITAADTNRAPVLDTADPVSTAEEHR